MGAASFHSTYNWDTVGGGWDYLTGPRMGVEDAYRSLVEQALIEHGHDAYNGTISTTRGVRKVQVPPMPLDEAMKLADERIDSLNKWEHCEAIPLLQATSEVWTSGPDREVTITTTGEKYRDTDVMKALIAKELGIKAEQVASYIPARDGAFTPKVTVERTVDVAATEGKTLTRYFIVKAGCALPSWQNGYPTQAAARAGLKTLAVDPMGAPVGVHIVALTRREDGSALVTGTVKVKKVTATLVVRTRTLVSRGKVGTTQAGWLFYGFAAC